MRCGLCKYMWGINEISICGGLMRCRLCKYMWRINEMWAV